MLRDKIKEIILDTMPLHPESSIESIEIGTDQLLALFNSNLKEEREGIVRECIEEFNHPEWCYDKAKQFKECPRCILEAKLATNTLGVKEKGKS